MKTTFAIAVLLGYISQAEVAQCVVTQQRHRLARAPRSQALVMEADVDEGDLVEEEVDERTDADEREDAAEAESERQEQLIDQMHRQSKRTNLSHHHQEEEDEEEQPVKRDDNEEDDQFVQESEQINEEEDESDQSSDENEDDEDEFMEQEEDDEENVQMEESEGEDDDDDDTTQQQAAQVDKVPQNSYFFAGDTNTTPEGQEYQRKYPEEFNEDSPNKFMHHILQEYALEQKDDKGTPSGQFFMNKKWTQVASREVLSNIKKMKGADLDKYMNQYFGRTWEHFDVNESNMLDALDMPAFMKYLCSDQSLDLDKL